MPSSRLTCFLRRPVASWAKIERLIKKKAVRKVIDLCYKNKAGSVRVAVGYVTVFKVYIKLTLIFFFQAISNFLTA
jgi:hypothetical protein